MTVVKQSLDRGRILEALRIRRRGPAPSTDSIEQALAKVVLDAIGDAVLGVDRSGRLTHVNKMGEQLLGREASLMYGMDFAQACPIYIHHTRVQLSNPMAILEEAHPVAQNAPGSVLVRTDGTEIPIEYSISPLYDQHGILAGAVFVFDATKDPPAPLGSPAGIAIPKPPIPAKTSPCASIPCSYSAVTPVSVTALTSSTWHVGSSMLAVSAPSPSVSLRWNAPERPPRAKMTTSAPRAASTAAGMSFG